MHANNPGNQESKKVSALSLFLSGTPLIVITFLLVGVYLAPDFAPNPGPILDLSQVTWKACYPDTKTGLCDSFETKVPKDIKSSQEPLFKGSVWYEAKFATPKECLNNLAGCALFIAEIGDAATITFNHLQIGLHGRLPPEGRYAKHYPVNIPIAKELFAENNLNVLQIKVHSFKNVQAGIRKGPVAIFSTESSFHLNRFQIAQNIIMPLISAFLIFLVALASIAWTFLRKEAPPELRALIHYSAAISFFLFSFTDLPREVIPVHWAGLIHHTARLLSDYFYFELIRICFFNDKKWLKLLGYSYIIVLFICPIAAAVSILSGNQEFQLFDFSYTVRRWAFPLLLIPHIMGVWGAYKLPRSNLRNILLFIFGLTTIAQINDSLIFNAIITGTYFIKTYPVLIALGMAFFVFDRQTQKILKQVLQLKADSLIAQVSTQVAHDIRSPLAALDMFTSDLTDLEEESRLMIRSAVSRIKDIANDLLIKSSAIEQSKRSGSAVLEVSEKSSIQFLQSVIEPLLTEKRLQFRSHLQLEIIGHIDSSGYGLFASIQPTEFKRVISNLINNAIEAFDQVGKIELRLESENNTILIKISDNGKGIPPHVLEKLGQRGETYGKIGGSGLGLFHAKNSMKLLGGDLHIESELGKGTTVILSLPKAKTPVWFVPELVINSDASIVILDDDSSIHQIWDGRFVKEVRIKNGVEIFHFATENEIGEWQKANRNKNTLFLCDYELLGQLSDGLSIIEKLNIGKQAILVTSHFEDEKIRSRCEKLGVRMIPKGLAAYVPIHYETAQPKIIYSKCDYILIDDDPLIRMTWDFRAKETGTACKIFSSIPGFLQEASHLDPKTPVFVDSSFDTGIRGEEASEEIFELGFKKIYLATGYESDKFDLRRFPWIFKVVGKEPPF